MVVESRLNCDPMTKNCCTLYQSLKSIDCTCGQVYCCWQLGCSHLSLAKVTTAEMFPMECSCCGVNGVNGYLSCCVLGSVQQCSVVISGHGVLVNCVRFENVSSGVWCPMVVELKSIGHVSIGI